jgi:hypothetical protein
MSGVNENEGQSGAGENRTRVGHTKADETDTYVGRGPGSRDMTETTIGNRGWLGNPFPVEDIDESEIQDGETAREASVRMFRDVFEDRLRRDDQFKAAVRDLSGDVLGCWCQRVDEDGDLCHAEVIAEHADRLAAEATTDSDLSGK